MTKLYNPFYKLAFLIGIFVYCSQSFAQVSSRDSLALVSLYNGTNGAQWATRTNWLTGNVPTWYGVQVLGGRVVRLNLPGNNMTGPATDSLRNLTALLQVDMSGNSLTSFPTLTGLTLDSLSLQNNSLTFKDLSPNKSLVLDLFTYSPQDSAAAYIDTTVVEQSSVSLKALVDVGLLGETYHWYKGATSLVSSASNTYTIPCMDSTKVGTYYCVITNSNLNGLTLYMKPINLAVQRLANPGSDFHVCDTNSTLQGVFQVGDSVIWSRFSGTAAITSPRTPVTAVTNLSIGANVFKYSVSANNVSCPAHTYSFALLTLTRDTNPSPAFAGANISVCGQQAILHADSPSVGIGTWTVISLGTAAVAQPNSPVTAVNGLSYGNNIFRWKIVNGACAPTYFSEVKVFRDDTLTSVSAGTDTSICPTSYVLSAPLPANTNWAWSVVAGSGTFASSSSSQTFGNDTIINTPVTGLSEFLNTFKWTVSNTCNSVSANVNVTVYDFTVANAGGPTQQVFYSPINPYPLGDSLAVGSGGTGHYTYVWSPTTNIDSPNAEHPNFLTPDSGTFTYSVTVTDGHGCTASASVTYDVAKKEYLAVPNLFTPNGDGVNDVLYIPGIESYPDNELTVVDRNDQVVYRKSGYTNNWGGTNELGFSQQGQKLPADTYYYTLNLGNGRLVQTGFFLIKY